MENFDIVLKNNSFTICPWHDRDKIIWDMAGLFIRDMRIDSITCCDLYLNKITIRFERCVINNIDIRGNVNIDFISVNIGRMSLDVHSVSFRECTIKSCCVVARECYSPYGALKRYGSDPCVLAVNRRYSSWRGRTSPMSRCAITQYNLIDLAWIFRKSGNRYMPMWRRTFACKSARPRLFSRDIIYAD